MPPATKRGLCWPTDNHGKDEVSVLTAPGSKVSWLYNWSPHPTPNAQGVEWVPMQWNHVNMDALHAHLRAAGAATLLAFNEPELPDQANMSAELAAAQWLHHIEPLRSAGVRCGSPGISSAPHAVPWLADFLARIRARGSDVDFYCLHWYGVELGQFYDYLWSTHHRLGPDKPVWVTEFACTNWSVDKPLSRDHVENFARESANYLDTLDWVEAYAWFGPMRDAGTVGRWAAMLDGAGKVTPLGTAYMYE